MHVQGLMVWHDLAYTFAFWHVQCHAISNDETGPGSPDLASRISAAYEPQRRRRTCSQAAKDEVSPAQAQPETGQPLIL
jgi:hypothetical protein